jgi:hypothetical protein
MEKKMTMERKTKSTRAMVDFELLSVNATTVEFAKSSSQWEARTAALTNKKQDNLDQKYTPRNRVKRSRVCTKRKKFFFNSVKISEKFKNADATFYLRQELPMQ